MLELKKTDEKLLSYLYHNGREPLTKIAKATRLSREQVEYRINKYQEIGLIKKFATFFNYSAFGYNYLVVILFKISNKKDVKEFEKKFNKDKHCISKGLVFNKYDIFLNMIFKDEKEFQEYLFKILDKHRQEIEDYFIFRPFFTGLYPLKFLGSEEKNIILTNPSENVKLDKKDLEILKLLEKNGREKIVDIANSVNISAELTIYKLKKLHKEKIIIGSRILFDMDKLGYFFSIISLNIKNLSLEIQNKLKQYAKQSPNVNSISLGISNPNCFIQLFYKNEKELRSYIKNLKELLGEGEISELDIILIEGEADVNTLPFL